MGIIDNALNFVATSARNLLLARAQTRFLQARSNGYAPVRKGIGERVMSGMLGGLAGYGWPGQWSQDRAEQVLHMRHWVHVAVTSICETVGKLEPKIAYVEPASASQGFSPKEKAYQAWYTRKSQGQVHPHERIEMVDYDHPLSRLLRAPNAWDTAGFYDVLYELVMFLKLTGNSYLWVVPNEFGFPKELWTIPSQWVWRTVLNPHGIDYYEIRPIRGMGTLRFPAEEVIHFRYKCPFHKIDGYAPLSAISEWIDTDDSIQRSRYWQFKQGCFPVGKLKLSGTSYDPDDPDLERAYAKLFSRFQGEQNVGKPMILGPDMDYEPLVIAPNEMAYVESSEQVMNWTLAAYHVPKEIAGIQDAGSEIAMYGPMLQFATQAIDPLTFYVGKVLTHSLCSRYDARLRWWWDNCTPDNPEQRNKDLSLMAQNGWVTPDEGRAALGYEPFANREEEERYALIKGKGGQEQPGGPGMPGAPAPGVPPEQQTPEDPMAELLAQTQGQAETQTKALVEYRDALRDYRAALVTIIDAAKTKSLLPTVVKDVSGWTQEIGERGATRWRRGEEVRYDDPAGDPNAPSAQGATPTEAKPASKPSGKPGKPTPAKKKPTTPASKARVVVHSSANEKTVAKLVKQFFKGDSEAIASVVGAPDDSTVRLSASESGKNLVVTVSNDALFKQDMVRIIGKTLDGKKFIKNDIIEIRKDQQGKGAALDIFTKQTEWAREHGVDYIKCHAARLNSEGKPSFNGFSTWPKLGYDADLDQGDDWENDEDKARFAQCQQAFPDAVTVQDLMQTREGAEWWATNGWGLIDARFDLNPDSASSKALDRYQQKKAEQKASPATKSWEKSHARGDRPERGGAGSVGRSLGGSLGRERSQAQRGRAGIVKDVGQWREEPAPRAASGRRWRRGDEVRYTEPSDAEEKPPKSEVQGEPAPESSPVKKRSKVKKADKPLPDPSASEPSEKALRALASAVRVDKTVQRYTEDYNEPRFAKAIGGESYPDSEPMDVATDSALIELKTLTVTAKGDQAKLTMDKYAQVRKIVKENEAGKVFHTVVSDDRLVKDALGEGMHDDSKRTYFYRRGIAGSARIANLYPCKDEEEVKRLMALPDDELPDQAKRTDDKLKVGTWEFVPTGERGAGYYRNSETGDEAHPKK